MDKVQASREIGSFLWPPNLSQKYPGCMISVAILNSVRGDVKLPHVMAAVDTPGPFANGYSITSIAKDIFLQFGGSDFASQFGGLELMFRHKQSLRRILRVSATAAGYSQIAKLQISDLNKASPFPGVGCWIYDNSLA